MAYFCENVLHLDIDSFKPVERENQKLDARVINLLNCLTFQKTVNGMHNANMATYLEQLPATVSPSIGRVNASKIQDAHHADNIKLAEICATINVDDLEADLSRFPEISNIDPVDVPFGQHLSLMVEVLNAKIWIEKCRGALLAAELAAVRKNLSKARDDFDRALIIKKNAEQVEFKEHEMQFESLEQYIKHVERLIDEARETSES